MDFVWVYANKFSFWHKARVFNELDYSVRSVKKHYPDSRCFVVGDNPGLDVIHLPAPPLVKNDPVTKQPRHQDHLNKLEVIFNSEVNEEFVLMCDDIFLMKPTTEEEIKTTYGRCEVEDPEDYITNGRKGGTPYKRLWLKTYEYIFPYLYQKGLKTYDWEAHLPYFYEKNKLKHLINSLNLRKFPRLTRSLYAAHHAEETKILTPGVMTDFWSHEPGMDVDALLNCHYLHIGDDAIVPELINRMKDEFGE